MPTIVASSPGDIVLEFSADVGGKGKSQSWQIPCKSLSASKSMEVSKEYGIGSHQTYAEVVGKIGYEGDFTIGSWYVDQENNPTTWNWLIKNFLTFQNDEGLPKEFTIKVFARMGTSMIRQGTGMYGTGDDAMTQADAQFDERDGTLAETDNLTIETYYRCMLKGDSTDIPEVGGTVSKKYPFSCMRRDPK